jgi:hypothetical protein
MIPKFQKRANYGAGAFFAGMILFIMFRVMTDPENGQSLGQVSWANTTAILCAMFAVAGYWYGIWAYIRAKGQSPVYAIVLPILGLIGLVIIAVLPDRASDPVAAEAEERRIDDDPLARRLRILRRPDWLASAVVRAITVGVLFEAADAGHNEDYFTLLRWAVLVSCAFTAYLSYKSHQIWTWIFVITALFFQPFVPVHLERDTWENIDILMAFVLLVSLWFVPKPASATVVVENRA